MRHQSPRFVLASRIIAACDSNCPATKVAADREADFA